jgi:hypothetical protein
MTNYADYTYYTGTYKGAVIDTASFDLFARKATQEIKKYTLGNINDANIPDEAKMCCCEIAEAVHKADLEDTKGIASEKVGEYSVSYVSSEAKEKLLSVSVRSIIYNWLAMTGLLYRGCS